MDLVDIQEVFFEECREGLDVLESGLLGLHPETDAETINAIFRAAHSIKGAAGTLGFSDIAAFTHVMEALLDEMRHGRRTADGPLVDQLLESVDVLRGMVDAAAGGGSAENPRVAQVQRALELSLASTTSSTGGEEAPSSSAVEPKRAEAARRGWVIDFAPGPEMLKRGNEPLRLFRELGKLGELTCEPNLDGLPSLTDLEPTRCYVRWRLVLSGDVSREAVDDVFTWVEDDSALQISSLIGGSPALARPQTAAVSRPLAPKAGAALGQERVSEAAPAEPRSSKGSASRAQREGGSIRVGIDKVDDLINLVGELVITQSMLTQVTEQFDTVDHQLAGNLREGIAQLERNTRELQRNVLKIRMLPIIVSFSRFPRVVRDLSAKLGKDVALEMVGEYTEVDKTVLEKISDPLVHLVRNALDHGIESPDVRVAAGKPAQATLTLSASHEGGDIVITVADDGGGLDREGILAKAIDRGLVGPNDELGDERLCNLIFAPGFSTATGVSDVSGRGVGMDVVRRNIRDLGGNVTVTSAPGEGSEVTIRLPLTLAILDGQLAALDGQTYVLPLVNIVESLSVVESNVERITEESELYRLREEYIPVIRLGRVFGIDRSQRSILDDLLVVVEAEGRRVGLLVDELLGQQQVVIKSLETNFRKIDGVSGATILGDGTIALIVDIPGLVAGYFDKVRERNTEMKRLAGGAKASALVAQEGRL